jgi:ABC-2 type transport system ATP-binding protein
LVFRTPIVPLRSPMMLIAGEHRLWAASDSNEPVNEARSAPTSTKEANPVVSAENLRHSYDRRHFALDGVSFTVRRGEVFGLLGRNGAGKSTLIKAMTTLIQPTSGTLRVLGMDPAHDGQRIRNRIGVVQQEESFDFTTVQGNLDIYGMLWGIPKAERRSRREELLTRFGLGDVRKRRAFDLSGGQKRRVQVAREFMHDMEVLFLDEPTAGLDVIMRRTLLDSIRDEVRRGLTVVFTTHNLEEADYLCDRVAVIDEGRILVLDTVENLKRYYGGKQTIDLTVGDGNAAPFFSALSEGLGAGASMMVNGVSAVILTDDPKAALSKIAELSQTMGMHLEWLNVRKNTLEDVFLRSVHHGGETPAAA